ncbi:MAG: acyl-CoA dehydrogenase family protein [Candidatus Eisenbacteria bacterium]|nr:acyl-CoA dehydrogenase family protein [Candidatus Eisenbacteria bacterium]
MPRFQPIDYFQVDDLFTDEEILVRNTVRDFVTERVLPVIGEHFEQHTFPAELVPELASLGLFGCFLPEEYGCAGTSKTAYGVICRELERGDSGLRSFVSVQGSLAMFAIYTSGSEEQKKAWLPRMARGEAIGCFGLTEPDYGSDPGGLVTRAEKTSAGYLLNGAKMWITNGSTAHIAIVWAKLDGVIRGFLVEKGTPGYRAIEQRGKFSLRASDTSELIFENCEIPERNLLPESKGLVSPLKCLSSARYGIAWGAVGAAMDCFDRALAYSKERVQFGKPIASFQLVQEKLAHMATEITKAQLLAHRLGRLQDEGKARFTQISMAKRNNVFMALECARLARDILAANGIMSEYHVIRHMLNLEGVKTYEGTHDIHSLILGNDLTGLEAFR